MQSASEWDGKVPDPIARGVELELVPTRSQVIGVRWAPWLAAPSPSASADGMRLRVTVLSSGRIRVEWSRELPVDTPLGLELLSSGERVQILHERWIRATPAGDEGAEAEESGAEPPPVSAELRELYAKLEEIADNPLERERAFLFELDRQTLEPYMILAGIPPGVRSARLHAFSCLSRELMARLRSTFLGRPVVPITNCAWIELLAEVFWKATEKRFAPGATLSEAERADMLGDTLERFAAGALRRKVPLQGSANTTTWHFEPDSIFVFFFAEFAFAAIEAGVSVRCFEQLLPRLVRMQNFFCQRFYYKKKKSGQHAMIVDYNHQPSRALCEDELKALGSVPVVSSGLRQLVRVHLGSLASSFGPLLGSDPTCAAKAVECREAASALTQPSTASLGASQPRVTRRRGDNDGTPPARNRRSGAQQ